MIYFRSFFFMLMMYSFVTITFELTRQEQFETKVYEQKLLELLDENEIEKHKFSKLPVEV